MTNEVLGPYKVLREIFINLQFSQEGLTRLRHDAERSYFNSSDPARNPLWQRALRTLGTALAQVEETLEDARNLGRHEPEPPLKMTLAEVKKFQTKIGNFLVMEMWFSLSAEMKELGGGVDATEEAHLKAELLKTIATLMDLRERVENAAQQILERAKNPLLGL